MRRWACRSNACLDPALPAVTSSFALIPGNGEVGLERLAADLANGTWDRRYGHLREKDALDCGYRLVVAH